MSRDIEVKYLERNEITSCNVLMKSLHLSWALLPWQPTHQAALATAAVFELRSFSTTSQLLKPILTQETLPWQRCFPRNSRGCEGFALSSHVVLSLTAGKRRRVAVAGPTNEVQGLPTLH
ncbi:hypothetical protein CEXT_561361 [Caerostris extrusa]|uniref:Uncharacterized protein n=1 Tax=Caerostris extrusa TaxID=172846 RepID=A0AAV4NS59_CAEEX|nr:hypothetical protein CEXT_561361 [Caerostris extrusa]